MFAGVLVTENMVKFTPGSSNYVEMWKRFLRFLFEARLFATEVSLARHFVTGRFTACPGIDFAPFLQRGNHRGRMYRGT